MVQKAKSRSNRVNTKRMRELKRFPKRFKSFWKKNYRTFLFFLLFILIFSAFMIAILYFLTATEALKITEVTEESETNIINIEYAILEGGTFVHQGYLSYPENLNTDLNITILSGANSTGKTQLITNTTLSTLVNDTSERFYNSTYFTISGIVLIEDVSMDGDFFSIEISLNRTGEIFCDRIFPTFTKDEIQILDLAPKVIISLNDTIDYEIETDDIQGSDVEFSVRILLEFYIDES